MCIYTETIRNEGRFEGRAEVLFKLVSEGKLRPEDACEELMTVFRELGFGLAKLRSKTSTQ